jgi:hypothetical protein
LGDYTGGWGSGQIGLCEEISTGARRFFIAAQGRRQSGWAFAGFREAASGFFLYVAFPFFESGRE